MKKVLFSIPDVYIENVFLTKEAEKLAQNYIDERVVGIKHIADAQHIAIASVERVDILGRGVISTPLSLDCIRAFNSANLKLGYPILEIRSPREVIYEKEV